MADKINPIYLNVYKYIEMYLNVEKFNAILRKLK